MDESLAIAIRLFLATIAPSVVDLPMRRAVEKVDELMSGVADGEISPEEAASFIRNVVGVLS